MWSFWLVRFKIFEFHLISLALLTQDSRSFFSAAVHIFWGRGQNEISFPDLPGSPVRTLNQVPAWEANYNIQQRSIGHQSRQPSWAEANSLHPFTSHRPQPGRELSLQRDFSPRRPAVTTPEVSTPAVNCSSKSILQVWSSQRDQPTTSTVVLQAAFVFIF